MALRSKPEEEIPYKRFEADGIPAFDLALNGALDTVEQQGIQGTNEDPETIIVLRDGQKGPDGDRLVQAIVYIGATIQQVAEDLNTRQ
jgi:hypothetical protein